MEREGFSPRVVPRAETLGLLVTCALLSAACLPQAPPRMPGALAPVQSEPAGPRVAIEPFVWSPQRRLTWADFQGPPDMGSAAVAMTAYAMSLNTTCEGDRLVSRVTSTFLPHTSWVKSAYILDRRAESTLRHEQAHFDLSEVLARRLRADLSERRSPCDGSDAERVAIYAKYQEEDSKIQRQYDRETGHGTDSRQQQLWESRIQSWLKKLPE